MPSSEDSEFQVDELDKEELDADEIEIDEREAESKLFWTGEGFGTSKSMPESSKESLEESESSEGSREEEQQALVAFLFVFFLPW